MTNGTVTLVRCAYHPGGPVELPISAFYESDRTRNSAMCIECRKRAGAKRKAEIKAGTYTPKRQRWAPQQKPTQPAQATPAALEPAALITQTRLVKIGKTYIHEDEIRIVDTIQPDKVTIFTTILEIDGETKHPKNKKLIFTRQHWAEEYAAIMAWLGGAVPPSEPSINEQAAMALAEEATKALGQAKKDNADLQAKLDKFKALLD